MINQKEITRIAKKFQKCSPLFLALGDEVRQRIIIILAEASIQGMNVSAIAERSHLSRPAISHHLKILKDIKMISSYKKGTRNIYYICPKENIESIKDLIFSIENLISGITKEELEKEAPWVLKNKNHKPCVQ